MAMTSAVKDELSRVEITKMCCRKAEVSSILRFAGGLHLVAGHIVIEAELDTGAAARRLKKDLFEIYGHTCDIAMVQQAGLRKGTRYLVRVVEGGDVLARQTGIVDSSGRPVRLSRTVRSPNLGAPRPLRSPAPGRRPHLRLSVQPVASGFRRSPARCARLIEWSSVTVTRSGRCLPGSEPMSL